MILVLTTSFNPILVLKRIKIIVNKIILYPRCCHLYGGGDLSVISERKIYPTRRNKIGEMTCWFSSKYRNGKYPVLSIGPSSAIEKCGLIIFAGCIVTFFMYTIYGIKKLPCYIDFLSYLLIGINLFLFSWTLLCNPGITEKTFDYYRTIEFNEDIYSQLPNILSLPNLSLDQIKTIQIDKNFEPQRFPIEKNGSMSQFCQKCNIAPKSIEAKHCPFCQVCISDYDHHCRIY